MVIGRKVPADVTFHVRVRNEYLGGDNPYQWQEMTTDDYFKDKRVLIFSLPGAFTPTCSTMQLPGFEEYYDEIKATGIDEIYCISVNDSFVMNKWVIDQEIESVKVIADGSGEFTEGMGMLVDKSNLSFGKRSWRYAALVNDGTVEMFWEEPGKEDNCETDPYGETSPEQILSDITGEQ
jgi:peroxiredoxin